MSAPTSKRPKVSNAPLAAPMGTDMRYHDVEPDSFKDVYLPSDSVSFTLNGGMERALIPGSVYLEGYFEVSPAGDFSDTPTLSSLNAFMDSSLGAHSFISSTNTALEGAGGQAENITHYPIAVKTSTDTTLAKTDLQNKANYAMMRMPTDKMTQNYAMGVTVSDFTAAVPRRHYRSRASFSVKMMAMINRTNGEPVPFSRTENIRVTIRLANAEEVFYGPEIQNSLAFTYRLSRLTMRYHTIPVTAQMMQSPITAQTFLTVAQTIATQTSNSKVTFPSRAVSGVTIAFRSYDKLSQRLYNNHVTERITGLKELIYSFNDTISGVVSQPITDEIEALKLGLMSTGKTRHDSETAARLALLDGYVLGLSFGSPIDTTTRNFAVQITASSLSNTSPKRVFYIAHSQLVF